MTFCASCVVLSSSCDNIYHHLYGFLRIFFFFFSLWLCFFFSITFSSSCVNLKFVSCQASSREWAAEEEKRFVEWVKAKVKLFFYYFPLTSRLFCSTFSVTSLVHGLIEFLSLQVFCLFLVSHSLKKKVFDDLSSHTQCHRFVSASRNAPILQLPTDLLPLFFFFALVVFFAVLFEDFQSCSFSLWLTKKSHKFLLVPPFFRSLRLLVSFLW